MSASLRRCALLALLIAPAVGCYAGSGGGTLMPARTPHGELVEVYLTRDTAKLHGELIAASEEGIYLQTERLRPIPWADIARLKLLTLCREIIVDHDGSAIPDSETLRLVSRYPQGIDSTLASALIVTRQRSRPSSAPCGLSLSGTQRPPPSADDR